MPWSARDSDDEAAAVRQSSPPLHWSPAGTQLQWSPETRSPSRHQDVWSPSAARPILRTPSASGTVGRRREGDGSKLRSAAAAGIITIIIAL